MYAIEHTVRSFLQEPSDRPKLVLNFGCGLYVMITDMLVLVGVS